MSVIDPYLDYTQPTGWSTRVRECDNCVGMGNSMAVQLTRKEDGFLWHCFRCSKSGFFRDVNASPSQIKIMIDGLNKPDKLDSKPEVVVLPEYHDKFHPQGLVDLYDHYVEPDDIIRFEIGWNTEHQRVIFPLHKYIQKVQSVPNPENTRLITAKKLVGWSGKKLSTDDNKDKPKWRTIRQRDVKYPRFIALPEILGSDKRVVLVEDPISAIRISQLGIMGIGLMTTFLPYELYPVLRKWDVIVWLDDDAYDKACKYFAALNSNGVPARVVRTKDDPKKLSPEQIKEELPWQIN